jgi:putative hydrolase of the HAD superfamily
VRKAVLWDYGGVIATGPFEQFNAYEVRHGLPTDFIRRVNSTNPDHNAWAKLERSEIDFAQFDSLFAEESAALGHRVPGGAVLAMLEHHVRPEMVALVQRVKSAGYKVACLTNNAASAGRSAAVLAEHQQVFALFDAVVESSKVGLRKPEPSFYEMACEMLGVRPAECVFLDDLGVNLKPARAMGMATIKVVSAEQAIADLTALLGLAD